MTDDIKCPFCKCDRISEKYGFDKCSIYRCSACFVMFLYPRPSLQELKEVYSDQYFCNKDFLSSQEDHLYGYADYISERINKQYGYSLILDQVKDLMATENRQKKEKPLWLDIGCGLGYLMDVAFDRGYDVRGIEFSEHAVKYIKSKYVFPVECGTIRNMEFREKFDVVSMMDVIEHLQDPFADLRTIYDLMAPGGILIINTMDCDSKVSRLIGKRLEDFRRLREHLFFFGNRSIRTILEHYGFEIVKCYSLGHTFQLGLLLDRIELSYSRLFAQIVRKLVYPKWLLQANLHINPRTKMIIFARRR